MELKLNLRELEGSCGSIQELSGEPINDDVDQKSIRPSLRPETLSVSELPRRGRKRRAPRGEWTGEQLALLHQTYAAGMPLGEISSMSGRTMDAIQRKANYLGIKRPWTTGTEGGRKAAETFKETNRFVSRCRPKFLVNVESFSDEWNQLQNDYFCRAMIAAGYIHHKVSSPANNSGSTR